MVSNVLSLKIAYFLANSADPDEMVHFVNYNLGLHSLPKEQFMYNFCNQYNRTEYNCLGA